LAQGYPAPAPLHFAASGDGGRSLELASRLIVLGREGQRLRDGIDAFSRLF
jgi:hypothetical protein